MKYVYALAIFCSLILWSSCRNDFEAVPNTGNLEFSQDTIYLDTLFSNIGSSTYNLKVYNRSNEDINIPTVALARGENSLYRLNVDGLPGKQFQDIRVLAKDSIFIFVETTADIQDLPGNDPNFLYTDQIVFDAGANEQEIELVTLVQDAVFLFPDRFDDGTTETLNLGTDGEGDSILIEGYFLDDDELTFTNELPYVIYGFAAVAPNKTLNIEPGARIHFHANSGILVANTGSIKANGTASADPELQENQIIFQGDRLEPSFEDIPGQWSTIWMTQGSTNNEFSYCTIKNGTLGLLMDSNDGDETLTLKNVELYNHTNNGLWARTGNVYGENVVINNCGQASLRVSIGGNYTFNHSTFANYWTNGFRSSPAVSLENFLQTGEDMVTTAPLNANFNNCIIYGNELRELGLFDIDGEVFNFNFSNSLIRFEDPQGDFDELPNYDFANATFYTNSVFSLDPVFQDTAFNNFNIEMGTSGAESIGNTVTANLVPIDANGTTRDSGSPDAGAYESIAFPKEE
jgi:hypothetical protein